MNTYTAYLMKDVDDAIDRLGWNEDRHEDIKLVFEAIRKLRDAIGALATDINNIKNAS